VSTFANIPHPIDQFIAEIARLKQRVETLEKSAYADTDGYVEGWPTAAKLVGITPMTAMKRAKAGTFPIPCRTEPFKRGDGKVYSKPTWRRADLIAYAGGTEGK
jgi:hypothetical protein